jgi:malate/lactate dehydrogenase
VITDSRPEMITSHVMDFEQVLEQSPGSRLREGDLGDLRDSDVAVLVSSAPLVADMPRIEYLAKNASIADAFADALEAGWGGLVIVVTNPVDPLVTRLRRRTGLDRRRILGYTLNDSLRLRTGLAKALGVAPGSVGAWVIGEHGDLSVPLYDRVEVDGAAVELSAAQAAVAEEYRRSWYPRHVALDSGRSSTWTSGLGVARMVTALGGDGELWPASIVLEGEYGIHDVAVAVPVTIGRSGAEQIHEWELSADDLAALHASAEFVRAAAAGI